MRENLVRLARALVGIVFASVRAFAFIGFLDDDKLEHVQVFHRTNLQEPNLRDGRSRHPSLLAFATNNCYQHLPINLAVKASQWFAIGLSRITAETWLLPGLP